MDGCSRQQERERVRVMEGGEAELGANGGVLMKRRWGGGEREVVMAVY